MMRMGGERGGEGVESPACEPRPTMVMPRPSPSCRSAWAANCCVEQHQHFKTCIRD